MTRSAFPSFRLRIAAPPPLFAAVDFARGPHPQRHGVPYFTQHPATAEAQSVISLKVCAADSFMLRFRGNSEGRADGATNSD